MKAGRALIPDVQALKVFQDASDRVWYVDGESTPRQFDGGLDDFAASKEVRSAACVRLLGGAIHARLIAKLYERGVTVQVAAPKLVPPKDRGQTPSSVLLSMRGLPIGLPASLGGWHVVRYMELLPYLMHDSFTRGDCDEAVKLLQQLPVTRIWEFFEGLDKLALAGLVACVIDPRWHISMIRPESSSCLRSMLGLWPKIAKRREASSAYPVFVERYELVRSTVFTNYSTSFEPSARTTLWRQYDHYLAADPPFEHYFAELRVMQRFVTFFRFTWLDTLYRGQLKQHEPLFESKYFFKDAAEADAFTAYRAHCDKQHTDQV